MLYNLTNNKMKIIKVEDAKGVWTPVYEVIFMDRLVFASEDVRECENYIDKRGFLYYNLLLW